MVYLWEPADLALFPLLQYSITSVVVPKTLVRLLVLIMGYYREERWSVEVMEYWGPGLRPSLHHFILLHYSITPPLQYSIIPFYSITPFYSTTPSLHYSTTPPPHHSTTPFSPKPVPGYDGPPDSRAGDSGPGGSGKRLLGNLPADEGCWPGCNEPAPDWGQSG